MTKNDAVERALKFYADKKNYLPTEHACAATDSDNGDMAREALQALRADLAAAPKPDCVVVEEIKRNTDKHFCHEGRTGHYRPTFDEVIDYLASQGFIAVKEKAIEIRVPLPGCALHGVCEVGSCPLNGACYER